MSALILLTLVLGADSPDLAAYERACKLATKDKIDQLVKRLPTAGKDRPELVKEIAELRKNGFKIGLPNLKPGSVGTLKREYKVVSVKGDSAVLVWTIDEYNTDGLSGRAPLGTGARIAQVRQKVGEHDSKPITVEGIKTTGWQPGSVVTLPADQVFYVRDDGKIATAKK